LFLFNQTATRAASKELLVLLGKGNRGTAVSLDTLAALPGTIERMYHDDISVPDVKTNEEVLTMAGTWHAAKHRIQAGSSVAAVRLGGSQGGFAT
jgi:hypothetical protein